MTVERLGFLGRPRRHSAPVRGHGRALPRRAGLAVIAEESDRLVWFRLGDGTQLHVYGPLDDDHLAFGESPCVGFVVDDMDAMRARLEASGIALLWETQRELLGEGQHAV